MRVTEVECKRVRDKGENERQKGNPSFPSCGFVKKIKWL